MVSFSVNTVYRETSAGDTRRSCVSLGTFIGYNSYAHRPYQDRESLSRRLFVSRLPRRTWTAQGAYEDCDRPAESALDPRLLAELAISFRWRRSVTHSLNLARYALVAIDQRQGNSAFAFLRRRAWPFWILATGRIGLNCLLAARWNQEVR